MKARATLLAIPLIVGVAVAQSTSGQSGQTQSGQSGQQQTGSQSGSKTGSQADRTGQSGSQSGSQADRAGQTGQSGSATSTQSGSSSEPAMMKTQSYKGVLVDLACGSGASAATAAPGGGAVTAATGQSGAGATAGGATAGGSTETRAAAGSSTAGGSMAAGQSGSAGSANRSASGDCPVTQNSTQLGLKMDNGQVVRFDLVGNQRAQDALKTNKGWNKNMTANKPVKVKISGVMQGDKLIVSSIN